MQPGTLMTLLFPLCFLYFPSLPSTLVQVLPGFSRSQETEVICLPVELARSEPQLPRLSFSNLPAPRRGACAERAVTRTGTGRAPRPPPGAASHRMPAAHAERGWRCPCYRAADVGAPSSRTTCRDAVSVPIRKRWCWMGHSRLRRGPAVGFTGGYSRHCTQTQEIAVWSSTASSRRLPSGPAAASPAPVPGESRVLLWLAGVSGRVLGLGAGFDRGCVGRVPVPPVRDAEGGRRDRGERFAPRALSQLLPVKFCLLVQS